VDREAVLACCRGLKHTTEGFPFGPGVAVFKVGGKVFAIVSADGAPGSVSVKCDPGYAVALREQYPAVTAGYHLSKRHWNTIELDGSIPDDLLDEWIQDSYDIVKDQLPKGQRAALS
jgi:predicted DNA-binding protein (MmcQ/YjbR family)